MKKINIFIISMALHLLFSANSHATLMLTQTNFINEHNSFSDERATIFPTSPMRNLDSLGFCLGNTCKSARLPNFPSIPDNGNLPSQFQPAPKFPAFCQGEGCILDRGPDYSPISNCGTIDACNDLVPIIYPGPERPVSVPEPSTLTLLVFGLLVATTYNSLRRKRY